MLHTIRRTAISLITILVIGGCSVIPQHSDSIGYSWEFKRSPISVDKWRVFIVEPFGIQCGGNSYACAIVKQPNVYCHVYVPKNAPKWVLEHEQKHCSGWNHKPRSYAEIRRYLPKTTADEGLLPEMRKHTVESSLPGNK